MTAYPLRVTRKRVEAPDAVSLWFDIPSDLKAAFRYKPGQFITIESEIGSETLKRQYSLSSCPTLDDDLRITVKKISDGRMSSWLVDKVSVGDLIDVEAPRGRFFQPPDSSRHIVLLACGSGIAPMLPIARHLLHNKAGHKIVLAYGNRHAGSIILADEVRNLANQQNAPHVNLVLSQPESDWGGSHGHIDADFLATHHPVWRKLANSLPSTIYLCGPESFMSAAEAFYLAAGVDPGDIRRESFNLVLDDDEPPLTVGESAEEDVACQEITAVVAGETYTVDAQGDESILAALLRAGADVPYSCQEGTCSSCISKLKEGRATVHAGVLKTLRQADLDEGLLLACLARPSSRLVRIDFDDI
jgi:ferredoxin-NADP reductase